MGGFHTTNSLGWGSHTTLHRTGESYIPSFGCYTWPQIHKNLLIPPATCASITIWKHAVKNPIVRTYTGALTAMAPIHVWRMMCNSGNPTQSYSNNSFWASIPVRINSYATFRSQVLVKLPIILINTQIGSQKGYLEDGLKHDFKLQ